MTLDPLLKSIIDAPVGQVENALSKLLGCEVNLVIIEQNQLAGSNFVRKVTINANEFPLIRATVKFDSNVLPSNITSELLKKRDGIGTILTQNNICAEREGVSIDFDQNRKKAIRKYRIVYKSLVWFEILEEIRLDYIRTCKNS